MRNADPKTVESFGEEWTTFDQSRTPSADLDAAFEQYFRVFPWQELPAAAEGLDVGCGSGRWAARVAPRVATLHCVDASADALASARRHLRDHANCRFHHASVADMPVADGSMDFAYALGVLHHLPDTADAMRRCVEKLKVGAPMLVYVYYAFDNRPSWFRLLWRISDLLRRGISRLPYRLRGAFATLVAVLVYWPLARLAKRLERTGRDVDSFPLSYYRDRELFTMRTDARDRFGTPLERRFAKDELVGLMLGAGL